MTKRIAKRKLTEIDFQHDGAHVALTSKEQGFSANGHPTALVLKSNFTKEVIEKIQQVRVTMELPDFLRKFFSLYGSDAEVLARMMGYVPETEEKEEWSYEGYIQEQLESFEILKSANEGNSIEVLAALTGEQYLQLLQDQESLEKAFADVEKNTAPVAAKGLTDAKAKAKDSGEKKPKVKPSDVNKGKQMEDDKKVEMIEKSQFEVLKKANETMQAELTKALEDVAVFKAEKQAAVEKARLEKLIAAVGDKAKADKLFKALKLVETDAEFEESVAVLAEMHKAVEKSTLFEEKGLNADDAIKPVESAVSLAIKKNLAK